MSFDAWSYYKTHIISATSTLTSYQVQFTVHYGSGTDSGSVVYLNSHCNPNFSDIRFTNSSGTSLPYWIENYTSGSVATVWVKIDAIAIAGSTIRIYYGNSIATSESSGDNTFDFFDDFPNASLDTNKWTVASGTWTISNGALYCAGTGRIYKSMAVLNTVIESKIVSVSPQTDLIFGLFYQNDSTHGALFCRRDTSSYRRVWGDGSTYYSTGYNWTSGSYQTDKIIVGATVATSTFSCDGNAVSSIANYYPAGITGLGINSYGGSSSHLVDWVRVRKYAAVEPTQSIWGSEVQVSHVPLELTISNSNGVIPFTPTITIFAPIGLLNFNLMFGDGNSYSNSNQSSFSTTHTYTHFGTYNIYAEGYSNSTLYSSYVTVTASNYVPTSSFSFIQSNNTISFTNTSSYATQNFWEFGDSTYSEVINPIHTYTQVGTYNVKLYSSNDYGNSSTSHSITISNPTPTISFTYIRKSDTNAYRFIPSITTILTLNETITSILWNFGDGSTSTLFSPSHIFTTIGNHTITLTVTNNYGSSSTSTQTISTTLLPIADFNPKFLNIITDVFPCRVQFINLSYPTYDTSLWSFGDSTTSNLINPYHDYANIGYYDVSLTVSNSIGSSTKTIYDCIKIHNESKEFIEKLQYADSNNHFNIHILTETIYPSDSMIHAHVFTEVASYTQKEIPDKPGIDEHGNLNLYNNINEFGEFIIGSLTEQAKRLLKVASSIDKTGFTHIRALEFDETIYYDSRFDENAT